MNNSTQAPTLNLEEVEETHETDANTALVLNICLILCILFAYFIKKYHIYYISESAAAVLLGVIVGGIARYTLEDLSLLSFDPEIFFFFLLPPIIFEAGYSVQRRNFFENLGAISLYAIFGTIISTLIIGYLIYFFAKLNIITGIDNTSPIEPLIFGSLISSVDPVATLSILGSPDLHCDPLLYSLVFGESVLNDAIAIVLFKSFYQNYDENLDIKEFEFLPAVLVSFLKLGALSISVGVGLGLAASFIYRHTSLHQFPKFETSLLFLFCYLCYATAEALDLSGILALFFHGIILSHYNSYNLSHTAHVTSDQIFATLATVTETIVFFYMGMGVFTGRFRNWNIQFTAWAALFCLIARAFNIFPLSFLGNCCRRKHGRNANVITFKMQLVLWFAGLRGAIAFALAENMPGQQKDTYATATLSICIFTTVVCGGLTERVLTITGMKQNKSSDDAEDENSMEKMTFLTGSSSDENNLDNSAGYDRLVKHSPFMNQVSTGVKGVWAEFDKNYLQQWFGGAHTVGAAEARRRLQQITDDFGDYELNTGAFQNNEDEDIDLDDIIIDEDINFGHDDFH